LKAFSAAESQRKLKNKKSRKPSSARCPADVRKTLRYASMLDQMKRGEAMMMMPYELEIK
jgi:hypothetical protein